MKLKTTFSEEREIDITLPFFRKDNSYTSQKYMAVLDEKTQISIFHNEFRSYIAFDAPASNDSEIARAYQQWGEVSEEEFMTFHEKILKSLSLTPQLCEVDREIEEELSRKNQDDIKDVL